MKGKRENQIAFHKLKLFVLMPFKNELSNIYLSIKEFLEYAFQIKCVRADEKYWSTSSYIDKIHNFIDNSDIVLAICSKGNPNVMYEVGYAVGIKKEIIFITDDSANEIPSNIKHYDFLFYDKKNFNEFLWNQLFRAIVDVYNQKIDFY